MKHLVLILLLSLFFFTSCQKKKHLNLLFEKTPNKVYIYPNSKSFGGFDIFTYKIEINKNYQQEIFFEPFNINEQKKYIESNGEYKIKLQQTEIDLNKLEDYNIKDYIWLEETISSFTNFQNLHQFYDKIYVIQTDSINKKIIRTEVLNVEIIE